LITYFIGNISAKKIPKSIHVHQSYSKPKVGCFLRHDVFIVAALYATCRLMFVCLFVGHFANEMTEVWQQISCTKVVRTGQNLIHW